MWLLRRSSRPRLLFHELIPAVCLLPTASYFMSAIQTDFDRIALLSADDGWTQNNHYHNFLLRHVPAKCESALEIGCGTGAFSRRLAQHAQKVLALDLSPDGLSADHEEVGATNALQALVFFHTTEYRQRRCFLTLAPGRISAHSIRTSFIVG